MVERVGDGTHNLNSDAQPVFLLRFSTNGTRLASGNFDVFLSGLLSLMGWVPAFKGNPVYSASMVAPFMGPPLSECSARLPGLTLSTSGMVEAVERSRNGIYACTLGDKTHVADIRARWGRNSWFNDLYFGLHGGMYVADSRHFAELRSRTAIQQAGDAEGLPVFQLDFCFRAPG